MENILSTSTKKVTVIRLRWLIVIISSYVLITSSSTWLGQTPIHIIILFYILSNILMYFVDDRYFESSYFYTPLVVFDTLYVTASLVISGQIGTDFYLAYFLIIILCTIWQDFRGLIIISVLATLLYGYFLLQTGNLRDESMYLRIPFLFVISLFYGYFAQVVRREKELKEQAEQEAKDMAMIQSLSQSLPSSLDYRQILTTLGQKINQVVHADKIYVLIENESDGSAQGLLFSGVGEEEYAPRVLNIGTYPIAQECLRQRNPVVQRHVRPGLLFDGQEGEADDFSFPLTVALPIMFREEALGAILLGFNEEGRLLSSREIQFCQIVAFATAIALSNAKKYENLEAEAKRRQIIADKLEKANRLKSEYLANSSHELRTPIATIMGYGNLLLEGGCGPMANQQSEMVERMLDNGRRLLGMVNNILDLSTLESGEQALHVRQQEVQPFLKSLRQEMELLEANKEYKVQYHVAEDVPPIETDWEKLKSICINLLINAVKFTNQGMVKLTVLHGSVNNEVSFVVTDTGVGIPEDQLSLIFEKFHQVDGSSSRLFEGAGLGLTIVQKLVELLGGRIEVESELGKGSTFRAIIPVSWNEEGNLNKEAENFVGGEIPDKGKGISNKVPYGEIH